MKTTEVLEQLKREKIRVPNSWAVVQTGAGDFLGFIEPGQSREQVLNDAKIMHDTIERIRAEREAAKNSSLVEL